MAGKKRTERIFDELTSPRTWVLLAAASAFLLASTILENYSLEGEPGGLHWYESAKTYAALLKEAAVATFIAFVVSLAIERSSRRRQEDDFHQFQREIATDVLYGVMKKRFPEPIWKEIEETILSAQFVRGRFHATYEFHELRRGKDIDRTHIGVTNEIFYTLRNIDAEPRQADIGLSFRVPDDADIRALSTLEFLKIGSEEIHPEGRMENNYAVFKKPMILQPGQEIGVTIRYRMIKFRSDYEVWTAMHPTGEARFDIISHIDNLRFSAESLQRYPIKPVREDETGRFQYWEFTRPILPFQGVMIFWRERNS